MRSASAWIIPLWIYRHTKVYFAIGYTEVWILYPLFAFNAEPWKPNEDTTQLTLYPSGFPDVESGRTKSRFKMLSLVFSRGCLLRVWNEKYLTRKIRLPGKSMLCVIIARHLSVWWQKWSCRKKSQCHWSTPFPGFLLLTNQANRTLVELAFLGVEKKWLDVVLSFNGFVGVLTWFTTQAFFHPLFSYPSDIKTSKWQKHTWWNTSRTINASALLKTKFWNFWTQSELFGKIINS